MLPVSAARSVSSFAVTIKGTEPPRHAFDLVEMQGEVVFLDAKSELESLQSSAPSPLGTLLLPATGKGCTIRMGTLALEGEAGKVKTPMLVLKRVEAPPPQSVKRRRIENGGGTTSRPEERDKAEDRPNTYRHVEGDDQEGPMLVSDAWSKGLLLGEDASSSADTLHYEVVGTIVKRYHFKSKTTRQFNK